MKKIFLFAGNIIAMLSALDCLILSISAFTSNGAAPDSALLANAIFYLIFFLLIGALSGFSFAFTVYSFKKDVDLGIASGLLTAAASVMLVGIQILLGVNYGKAVDTLDKALKSLPKNSQAAATEIYESQTSVLTLQFVYSFVAPLLTMALAILSFFKFGACPSCEKASSPKDVKTPKASGDALQRLKDLKELFDSGVLNEEEFKAMKETELKNY
ncbi:MAG: SHOCT domain-containing protein [Bacilli bacterium]|nr:SHOCT domain-containing protein [Bacilli bacterium]